MKQDYRTEIRPVSPEFMVVPLKALMFGGWPLLILLILSILSILLLSRRRQWKLSNTLILSFSLAFGLLIMYAYFIEVPKAMATYYEMDKYYYTEDHIGRPFSLRDDSRTLRWYENHYAFGEIINEDTPNGAMTAGGDGYQITWKPNFRFPGQYEDADQGIAYTSTSFLVQNHYREYLPELGRYNRVDSISLLSLYPQYKRILNNGKIFLIPSGKHLSYGYSHNNALVFTDSLGQQSSPPWYWTGGQGFGILVGFLLVEFARNSICQASPLGHSVWIQEIDGIYIIVEVFKKDECGSCFAIPNVRSSNPYQEYGPI